MKPVLCAVTKAASCKEPIRSVRYKLFLQLVENIPPGDWKGNKAYLAEHGIDVDALCKTFAHGATLSPCVATQQTLVAALPYLISSKKRVSLVKALASWSSEACEAFGTGYHKSPVSQVRAREEAALLSVLGRANGPSVAQTIKVEQLALGDEEIAINQATPDSFSDCYIQFSPGADKQFALQIFKNSSDAAGLVHHGDQLFLLIFDPFFASPRRGRMLSCHNTPHAILLIVC